MTKEKAIDLLDNLIGMVEDNQESDYDTALKMGIQALSQEPTNENLHREREQAYMQGYEDASKRFRQEPCDDVVSRKAVLNAIEREDKWLLAAKGHNGLTEIAFSGLKARVDALPPVTQKSGKVSS